jgi:hypothetical protein
MTIPFNIPIPKRAKTCFLSQEDLLPGMDYFSLLIENDSHGYDRQDFCSVCWNQTFKNLSDKMLTIRHWKSKVPAIIKVREIPQNRDVQIMSLLKTYLESNLEENVEESFVLSLYLSRKRVMSLRKEIRQEDNTIVQLYEILETEEMLLIKKVDLSTIQIGNIQLQIAKKLKPHEN